MKKLIVLLFAGLAVMFAAGCQDTDANVVSHNISDDADRFEIFRRIVGTNAFTDTYLLEIVGFCNIKVDREDRQLEVTCKTGPEDYKKHYLGMSDNSPYTVEQLESARVSPDFYQYTYKPTTLIPDIDFR